MNVNYTWFPCQTGKVRRPEHNEATAKSNRRESIPDHNNRKIFLSLREWCLLQNRQLPKWQLYFLTIPPWLTRCCRAYRLLRNLSDFKISLKHYNFLKLEGFTPTAYHSQGNGQFLQYNQTIVVIVRPYLTENQGDSNLYNPLSSKTYNVKWPAWQVSLLMLWRFWKNCHPPQFSTDRRESRRT